MYEITLGKHFIFLSFHFLCLFSNDPGKGQLCTVHTFQWAKLEICMWLFCAISHLVPGRTDRMRPTGNTCDISAPEGHGSCPLQGEPPQSQSSSRKRWGLCRWSVSSSRCWPHPGDVSCDEDVRLMGLTSGMSLVWIQSMGLPTYWEADTTMEKASMQVVVRR